MHSISHSKNALSSSDPKIGIDESSVWCYDEQTNNSKILTSTPKFGFSEQRLDFKTPTNLQTISNSFDNNSLKEKTNTKLVLENDENFNLQTPSNLKKIHYSSLISKNLNDLSKKSIENFVTNENVLLKTPKLTNTNQICLKDSNKQNLSNSSNLSVITIEKTRNMSQLTAENVCCYYCFVFN